MQNSPPIQYMKWLLCIFLFAIPAFGQEKKCDHHSDSFERFSNIRLLPPATVLYLEPIETGYKLEIKMSDKHEVRYETFTLTKETPGVKSIKKGDVIWILLCNLDQFVYVVQKVTPGQIK